MRKSLVFLALNFIVFASLLAQNEREETAFTTGEFRAGYGSTQLGTGLKDAYEAGNFSSTGGGLFTVAVYRKFAKVPYFHFGLKFKALGAGPSKGDNGNEMFFNYWNNGVSVKFYPFDRAARKGLVLFADYFYVGQFTQKYRNTARKEFNHQFAIGSSFNGGIGYDFPLGEKKPVLTIGIEYEVARRRGEVSEIGGKTFQNANLGVSVGVRF